MTEASYTLVGHSAPFLPEEYRGVIYSKWMRSLRHGNDYYRLVDPPHYYEAYQRYISAILGKPDTMVRLAVLSDDRDVVLGFSVSRDKVLDYVYVDKLQRKQGIGKMLVPPSIEQITHVTKTGLTIWGSKYGHWKFNPFA